MDDGTRAGDGDPADDPRPDAVDDALIERLRVIEEQPLAERPASYAALHDELTRRLEQHPVRPPAP